MKKYDKIIGIFSLNHIDFLNWLSENNIDYSNTFKYKKEIQQLGNSKEARAKARVTVKKTYKLINHQQGEKNSQYGTCWIYHSVLGNRKCKKEELEEYIKTGWVKGRKINLDKK